MQHAPVSILEKALSEQRRRLLASAGRYVAIAMAFGETAAAAQMIDRAATLLDRARRLPAIAPRR